MRWWSNFRISNTSSAINRTRGGESTVRFRVVYFTTLFVKVRTRTSSFRDIDCTAADILARVLARASVSTRKCEVPSLPADDRRQSRVRRQKVSDGRAKPFSLMYNGPTLCNKKIWQKARNGRYFWQVRAQARIDPRYYRRFRSTLFLGLSLSLCLHLWII